MKKLLSFLLTVLIGLSVLTMSAQNTLTVADGSTTNEYIPMYGLWADANQHIQVIYPASMLTQLQGQAITSMTFYSNGNPDWGNIVFTISMMETNDSTYSSSTFVTGTMDVVYSGHTSVSNNQLVFVFDDGFPYTGGNLLFDLQTVTGGTWESSTFNGISASSPVSIYSYNTTVSTENFIPKTTFTYETPETCVKPNSLQISGIINSSATFSWHPRATGTSYVAIGVPGEDITTLAWTAVTDTSYTFNGLTAGSHYTAYVKTDCGGGDESNAASKSFYTYCDAVSQFPWFEGFENDWLPAIVLGQELNAPECWKVFHGSNGSATWKRSTDSYYVYEGNGSALYNSDSYSHNEWLITPLLNIPDNQMLSFFAASYNEWYSLEEISIWISDENPTLTAPASDTSALPGFTHLATFANLPTDWYAYEVPLSNYTGNRYIAFVRKNNISGYALLLDNVSVSNAATCMRPTALAADSTGSDFAILSWQSDATSFNLYYRYAGDTEFNVVTEVTLDADSTYTLTNLTPGQTYEWYVSAICDEDTLPSYYTSPFGSFITECAQLSTLPYTCDFESNLLGGTEYYPLPACWSRIDNTYPYVYFDYDYYSNQYLNYLVCGKVEYYTSYDGNPKIVTLPELDNNLELNTLQLNFWAKTDYYNSALNYPTLIEVGAMSDPTDETTFTPIDTVSNINTSNTEYQIALSGYTGTAHHIAMRMHPGKYYESYSGAYTDNVLIVDDLTISFIPSCPRPEAVTATNVTSNSVSLTWTSEESSFMVYYKVHGASSYTGIEDGPVSDTTYTLTGLQSSTLYDLYVASVCSDESETPSISISFSTSCVELDTVPHFWDFESNNTAGTPSYPMPACWTRGNISTYDPYSYNYDYYAYEGDYSMEFYGLNTAALPAINTEVMPISSLMVSFYARYFYDYNASAIQVGVMTDPTDPTTFVQVGNDIPLTTIYTLYEQSLASYQGTGTYIAFRVIPVGDSYSGSANLDNVLLSALPDCQRPTTFNANIGLDNATITWNANEDQDEWEVAVGNATDDPETLPTTNVSTNSYTLDNLDPNTTYTIFVRTICGTEESDWSAGYTFTTLLSLPATLPYACNFEDPIENANWTLLNGNETNKWYIDTAVNNTANGSHSLYISNNNGVSNNYNGNASSVVWAYRDIQFTDANEFVLSFDWKCDGESTYDYMKVYIGPHTTVTPGYNTAPAGSIQLGGFHNQSLTWQTENVILDNQYSNTTRRLFFMWRNDSSVEHNPPAAIDNISVSAVSCARPVNVSLAANNIGSATLNITPGSESDAMWEVSLNDSLFVVTDTLPVITVTPGTEYVIYVRTICDGGDTSVWSLPLNFISRCDRISNLPQTWGFESDLIGNAYEETPICWNIISSYPDYTYPYVYVDDYYSSYAHTGTHSLYFYNSYPGYAVLPEIDAQILDLQNLQLSFFANTSDHSGMSSLQVGVMTDPTDATTFTPVQTLDVPYEYGSDPIVVTFEDYTGDGTYIAFRNLDPSNTYASYSVDDVTLDEIPTCPTPTALTVSDITMTTAVVAWTENGSAISWNIKLDDGTTETTVLANSNPYTLTNLTAGTNYEISIQAICSESEVSPWRLPENFSTAFCDTADQCIYTFNLTDDYGDGWNNGYLTVTQNDIAVATVTLSSGSSGTELVTLCDNSPVSLVWVTGQYPDEVGFTVLDPNGTQIFTANDMTAYTTHTFTTDCDGSGQTVTEPTVTTEPATAVSQTAATLHGTITNPDDVTITAQGFEWKPVSAASYTVLSATGNTMSATINNLTPSTDYTYRAFVTTASGTQYGDDVTFTTLEQGVEPCDVPTGLTYSDVTGESIAISWNAVANTEGYNIQYSPQGGSISSASTTTNSYTITGLAQNTTYQIQVQANCGDGNLSGWSDPITVTTTGISDRLSNSIALYPNPANDVVNVECKMNNVQLEGIEVIDVYGKVVRNVVETMCTSSLQTRINVSGLAAGMYFVRVTTDAGVVTKSFVKN